jgi:ribonuclease E
VNPTRRTRKAATKTADVEVGEPAPADAPPAAIAGDASPDEAEAPKKPARRSRAKKAAPADAEAATAETAEPSTPPADNDPNGDSSDEPRRGGWWQRTFG